MSSPRREALQAGGLALALWVVLCLPFTAPGPVFFRDQSQNFLPVRELAAHLRASGAGTAWNPILSGGTPLDANPNSLLLHPAWQFDRLMPVVPAIKLSIALQILLAGTCLALWLSRRGASIAASAAGGILLACSGPMLSLGTLPNLLTAACWIPPALLALQMALEGRRWAIPLAVFSGACCLIPADPVSALTLGVAVTLGFAVDFGFAARAAKSAPPLRAHDPGAAEAPAAARSRGRGLLALFLPLSVCAALVQWIPAWSLISRSERGEGFAAGETLKWSLLPARLPELFVSGWTGDPTSVSPDRYWGATLFETGLPLLLSITWGTVALLLAVAGVAGSGAAAISSPPMKRERAMGAVLLIGGLALALGRHVPFAAAIATRLPGAGLVRYPEKFLIAATLGAAILAAIGVDRLSSGERPGLARRIALFAGLLAAIAFVAASAGAAPAGTTPTPDAGAALAGSLRLAGALALGAALIVWLGSRGRLKGAGVRTALLALVALELLSGALGPPVRDPGVPGAAGPVAGFPPWGMRLNPVAPGLFLAASAIPCAVRPLPAEPGRTVRLERPDGFELKRPDDRIAWGFLWDRISLARSWPAAFGQPTAFDLPTDRLVAADVARAARVATRGPLEQRVRLWSMAGVASVTSYEPLDHPALVETGRYEGASRPGLVRYENRDALPAGRMVRAWEVRPGPEAALTRALEPGFDPSRLLVIEQDAGLPGNEAAAAPAEPAGNGAKIIQSPIDGTGSGSRWVVALDSPAPALLALAENWDPGWKAELDGAQVPVLRANGFLVAVPVPRGLHEVIVEYRPRERTAGLFALALAAGLSIAAAFAFPAISPVKP